MSGKDRRTLRWLVQGTHWDGDASITPAKIMAKKGFMERTADGYRITPAGERLLEPASEASASGG